MQRKLEIAWAIATNVKLIILDEPAAGMNPQESEGADEIYSETPTERAHHTADRT